MPKLGAAAFVYVEYAGFWRRFAAYIIDTIIVNVIGLMIGFLMGLIIASTNGRVEDVAVVIFYVIGYGVGLLYYAICESSPAQATAGKLALSIKVTDMDGKRISFLRAMGRYFGKLLSGLLLGIGYLMIAFTLKKQGLHDMMAGTLVVLK